MQFSAGKLKKQTGIKFLMVVDAYFISWQEEGGNLKSVGDYN